MASAVVVCGGALLLLTWLLGPVDGLMWKWLKEEDVQPEHDAPHST